MPHPLMLYNLAQVFRLAGDAPKALSHYRDFLASNPTGEAAKFARKYVRILERKVFESTPRSDSVDGDTTSESELSETGPEDIETGVGDEDGMGKGDDEDDGAGLRYGGLGLAAAGLVSIAIGAKFGADAQSLEKCLDKSYPDNCEQDFPADRWTGEALLLFKEGESAERKMFIFTGIGAALIVGGGFIYYMGDQQASESKTKSKPRGLSVAPSVHNEELGLVLSGRF